MISYVSHALLATAVAAGLAGSGINCVSTPPHEQRSHNPNYKYVAFTVEEYGGVFKEVEFSEPPKRVKFFVPRKVIVSDGYVGTGTTPTPAATEGEYTARLLDRKGRPLAEQKFTFVREITAETFNEKGITASRVPVDPEEVIFFPYNRKATTLHITDPHGTTHSIDVRFWLESCR